MKKTVAGVTACLIALSVTVSSCMPANYASARSAKSLGLPSSIIRLSDNKINLKIVKENGENNYKSKRLGVISSKKVKVTGIDYDIGNKKICSYSNGLVTAKKKGKTKIKVVVSATYKGQTFTRRMKCKVVVKKVVKNTQNSENPTAKPTTKPTASPTIKPSVSPSAKPTTSPSVSPSVKPSISPSVKPSASPSISPTASPSTTPIVSATPRPDVDAAGCDKLDSYIYSFDGSGGITLIQIADSSLKKVNPSPKYTVNGIIYPVRSMMSSVFNSVTSVNVPETVEYLDLSGINNPLLAAINVDARNSYYQSISGMVYNSSGRVLLKCPAMAGSDIFELSDRVTSVDSYAFRGNTIIKTLKLGNSITEIDDNAFSDAIALQTVTLGKAVKVVKPGAFDDCSNLKAIDVVPSNSYFQSSDGMLIDIEENSVIRCPEGLEINTKAVKEPVEPFEVLPYGVSKIGEGAFRNCSGLSSICISSNVKEISNSAFYNCRSLEELQIGYASVTTSTGSSIVAEPGSIKIGDRAFERCSNLKSASLSSAVKEIGFSAFESCRALNLVIPNSVTKVGNNAFKNTAGVSYSGSLDVSKWGIAVDRAS